MTLVDLELNNAVILNNRGGGMGVSAFNEWEYKMTGKNVSNELQTFLFLMQREIK